MGGDAEGKFLDMVTLDTKLSWGGGRWSVGGRWEADASNRERVQILDNIVREVYSLASGLVNNNMEVLGGRQACNCCQCSAVLAVGAPPAIGGCVGVGAACATTLLPL